MKSNIIHFCAGREGQEPHCCGPWVVEESRLGVRGGRGVRGGERWMDGWIDALIMKGNIFSIVSKCLRFGLNRTENNRAEDNIAFSRLSVVCLQWTILNLL